MYNAGEDNSVVAVEIVWKQRPNMVLRLWRTVTNKSEVNQAALSLVERVMPFMYPPTIQWPRPSARVKVANSCQVPVFGSERAHVEQGPGHLWYRLLPFG